MASAAETGSKPGADATREATVFERVALPVAIVLRSALDHNVATFAAYCRDHDVELAPHVKATMSRQIFAAQQGAGAWAATVATVAQARAVRSWGVQRLLIANEVVDRAGLDWLVREAEADPACEIYCWVDSPAGVEAIEAASRRAGTTTPVRALLELGHAGGRTGCRTVEAALDVAAAVSRSRAAVELHGVAGFEGLIRAPDAAELVDRFLDALRDMLARLRTRGLLTPSRAIVSAGGSACFDRVVAAFADASRSDTRVVVRSGCYVTHDHGMYAELSPLGRDGGVRLRPALEVWGAVLSTPEPGLAIVGFGRRDVGSDAGLPRPVKLRSRGEARPAPGDLVVAELNDQHAYVTDPRSELAVGDLLGAGISHPCTTFDKWRELALVDDAYRVLGRLDTAF